MVITECEMVFKAYKEAGNGNDKVFNAEMRQVVRRRSWEPSVSFVFLTSYNMLNIKKGGIPWPE